jgi:7-keto-8-aminopelargonate synthetase-like enzyme
MAMMLQEEGVFANVAVPPAVPNGKSLIRTSYMATHTDEHLDAVLRAFEKVGRSLGLI